MKIPWLFGVIVTFGAVSISAQIQTISTMSSSGGFGGVTTIAPNANGFSYTTIGGPRSGEFGSVQVTGGNAGAAVLPRGGIVPIVTPAVSQTLAPSTPPRSVPLIPPLDLNLDPSLIPVPVSNRKQDSPGCSGPALAPGADLVLKEYKRLFSCISDRDLFWKDFYRDWRVAPKTPVPAKELIPYLRLWLRTHGPNP